MLAARVNAVLHHDDDVVRHTTLSVCMFVCVFVQRKGSKNITFSKEKELHTRPTFSSTVSCFIDVALHRYNCSNNIYIISLYIKQKKRNYQNKNRHTYNTRL